MTRVLTREEIDWVRECRAARDSWAEIAEAGGYAIGEVKAAFRAAQAGGARPRTVRRRISPMPLLGTNPCSKSGMILAVVEPRPRTSAEIAEAVGLPVVNVSAILCGLRAGKRVESRKFEGRMVWSRTEAQA